MNSEYMIYGLITLIVLILIFFLVIGYMSYGNQLKSGSQPYKNVTFKDLDDSKIKVMSWNVSFFFGPGSEGLKYEHAEKNEYEKKIMSAINLIKSVNPDILLIQEIDFKSYKSSYMNQVEILAQELGYNYAYARTWKINYLPYPKGRLKNHFKDIDSGGAIFTKFPMTKNYVHLLERPKDFILKLFYPHRYAQCVTLKIGDSEYQIINTHLEAFKKKNREKQAKELKEIALSQSSLLLIGGDFNTTPKNAKNKTTFKDFDFDSYEGDSTYNLFTDFLRDTLKDEDYENDELKYFTFSSELRERKLDYIFIRKQSESLKFEVLASNSSDHLPILCEIKI